MASTPKRPAEPESDDCSVVAKRANKHTLKYDNVVGRDALARNLHIFPDLLDLQRYGEYMRTQDFQQGPTHHLAWRVMSLRHAQQWLAYTPAMPCDESPDHGWELRQDNPADLLPLFIIRRVVECDVLADGTFHPKDIRADEDVDTYIRRICDGRGYTIHPHGDLLDVSTRRSRVDSYIKIITGHPDWNWENRLLPDPGDFVHDELDELPMAFFPVNELMETHTASVHAMFLDLCKEAEHSPRESIMERAWIASDYRMSFSRLLSYVQRMGEGVAEANALFRAIALDRGIDTARTLVAELFCGRYEIVSQRPCWMYTALLNFFGQTWFPSVFLNIRDLHPATLALEPLPRHMEWCAC